MAHTSPHRHHVPVLLGFLLGLAFSGSVVSAARDDTFADALPSPWVTASLGLVVIAIGWVTANATPRFAAALAMSALPGALYGSLVLAWQGDSQLSYGWSAMPIALGCLAFGASLHASKSGRKPWSARRGSSPSLPRTRTR